MKAKILAFLLALQTGVSAQRLINISYGADTKGRYVFTCTNRDYCNYVLSLDLPTLTNATADRALPYVVEVKPGVTKLLTVSPIDPGQNVKFSLQHAERKGCLHPAVNANFTYLLPIAPGQETQAYRITHPRGTTGGPQDTGYAVRLRAHIGDTIYAARRGVVTVVDVSNTDNDAGQNSLNGWNRIEIAQGDCSFAEYGVLKKDGAFVRPGQQVEAGTPIGLVGGDRYGRGADVRLSVSYDPDTPNTEIPLQFWTKGNGKGPLRHGATYISEFPRAILTQELPRAAGHAAHRPTHH